MLGKSFGLEEFCYCTLSVIVLILTPEIASGLASTVVDALFCVTTLGMNFVRSDDIDDCIMFIDSSGFFFFLISSGETPSSGKI